MPIPVPGSPVTLLDVGANDSARPEHLVQFAHMGAALTRSVLGIAEPRVGLLSNGTEPGKGRDEVVEAHERPRGDRGPAFVGNVEGFSLTAGVADVIVTDGFTGNVALKVAEAVSQAMLGYVRSAATSTPRAKAGGLLLRPALRPLRDELEPRGLRRRLPARAAQAARRPARVVRRRRLGRGRPPRGRGRARGRHRSHVPGTFRGGALKRVPASDPVSSL
jgi:glycerol-3-phosphate acyltransferase PlsX